jgi:1-acyl-sn-glycerol-3-phosphate acyltransferase
MLPFMSGPFYIAIKANVPIVPMALIGTYEALPMNTHHVMPRPAQLIIGTPISPEGHHLRDLDALSVKVEKAIRELIESA